MPTYSEIPKDNINENLADSYLGEIADASLSTLVGSGIGERATIVSAPFLDEETALASDNNDELIIAQGDFLSASLTSPVTESTSQLNNTDSLDPITGTKKSEDLVDVSEIEKEPLLNPGATAISSPINRAAAALDVVKAYNNINPALLSLNIESGFFVVDETGNVSLDYVFDGGFYKGELAIFSLNGMEQFEPGSAEFISEAAKRALSNSELGHIVIGDRTDAARFNGELGETNFNSGEYKGVKTFTMTPGDAFAIMLVPNGTVQEVFDNPTISDSKRPLFSLVTANPNGAFHLGQIADITGEGHTFVMEDYRVDKWTDGDYNDIIFQIQGATGKAVPLDEVIKPNKDWRGTELGQEVLAYIKENAPILTLPKEPISEDTEIISTDPEAPPSSDSEIASTTPAPSDTPDLDTPLTIPAAIETPPDDIAELIVTTPMVTSPSIATEESHSALQEKTTFLWEQEKTSEAISPITSQRTPTVIEPIAPTSIASETVWVRLF